MEERLAADGEPPAPTVTSSRAALTSVHLDGPPLNPGPSMDLRQLRRRSTSASSPATRTAIAASSATVANGGDQGRAGAA